MSAKSAAGMTISEAIKRDHRDLERFYSNFGKSAGDLHAQQEWANQFIWENARHAVAEEIVVYPYSPSPFCLFFVLWKCVLMVSSGETFT